MPKFKFIKSEQRQKVVMPKIIIQCRKCQKPFLQWESQTAGLCSRECYNKERQDNVVERFWSKVEKTDSCWIWHGAISSNGYGNFKSAKYSKSNRIPLSTHRFAYKLVKGAIKEGLTLDHLCRNHACVNPEHLEPVTIGENNRRGNGFTGKNYRKTHCKRGHPFDNKNVYLFKGHRYCRECRRLYG